MCRSDLEKDVLIDASQKILRFVVKGDHLAAGVKKYKRIIVILNPLLFESQKDYSSI